MLAALSYRQVAVFAVVTVSFLPYTSTFYSQLAGPAWTSRASQKHGLLQVCMSSGPKRGEVRNPWGRAGKPETRAARLADMAETASLRAKAWRYAMSRDQSWGGDFLDVNVDDIRRHEDELSSRGLSGTKDLAEFHERAAMLLQDCGGRVNSLTFMYKWDKQFNENIQAFAARERLSIAAMLRQSDRFWVVDMPGSTSTPSSDTAAVRDTIGTAPLQIFVLLDKTTSGTGRGQPLGDALGMHGESEAIRQWRARRSSRTLSRVDDVLLNSSFQVVGVQQRRSKLLESPTVAVHSDAGSTQQLSCMKLPARLDEMTRLSSMLDALEPCISAVDASMGIRGVHMAWTSNCSCATGAAEAINNLVRLQEQAKGRQVRRLEDQIRAFVEVVQSGISTLGVRHIAMTLTGIVNRQGYESMWKFAANRLVQADMADARRCGVDAAVLAQLMDAFSRSGVRVETSLYRRLASFAQQIPMSEYTVQTVATVVGSLDTVGLRDRMLVRSFAPVLQTRPVEEFTAEAIASIAGAFANAGVSDDSSFRRLSAAAQGLPDLPPKCAAGIVSAFAKADVRDPSLFRRMSAVLRGGEWAPGAVDPETVKQLMVAFARAGHRDPPLMSRLGQALLAARPAAFTPECVSRIAQAMADMEVRDPAVMGHLAAAADRMEGWTWDVGSVGRLVDAYSRCEAHDAGLFARMATVLQQMDPVSFSPRATAMIVKAYSDKRVLDKALLGRLAVILQQMDAPVFFSNDAVQDVSVILNAYAKADMRDVALRLSHTLTNQLKPHVGGITAQAMANIVLRVAVAT